MRFSAFLIGACVLFITGCTAPTVPTQDNTTIQVKTSTTIEYEYGEPVANPETGVRYLIRIDKGESGCGRNGSRTCDLISRAPDGSETIQLDLYSRDHKGLILPLQNVKLIQFELPGSLFMLSSFADHGADWKHIVEYHIQTGEFVEHVQYKNILGSFGSLPDYEHGAVVSTGYYDSGIALVDTVGAKFMLAEVEDQIHEPGIYGFRKTDSGYTVTLLDGPKPPYDVTFDIKSQMHTRDELELVINGEPYRYETSSFTLTSTAQSSVLLLPESSSVFNRAGNTVHFGNATITIPSSWIARADLSTDRHAGKLQYGSMVNNDKFIGYRDPDVVSVYLYDRLKEGRTLQEIVQPTLWDDEKISQVLEFMHSKGVPDLTRDDISVDISEINVNGLPGIRSKRVCSKPCYIEGGEQALLQYFVDAGDRVIEFFADTATSEKSDQLLAEAESIMKTLRVQPSETDMSGWTRYTNVKFGFSVGVPPGFEVGDSTTDPHTPKESKQAVVKLSYLAPRTGAETGSFLNNHDFRLVIGITPDDGTVEKVSYPEGTIIEPTGKEVVIGDIRTKEVFINDFASAPNYTYELNHDNADYLFSWFPKDSELKQYAEQILASFTFD